MGHLESNKERPSRPSLFNAPGQEVDAKVSILANSAKRGKAQAKKSPTPTLRPLLLAISIVLPLGLAGAIGYHLTRPQETNLEGFAAAQAPMPANVASTDGLEPLAAAKPITQEQPQQHPATIINEFVDESLTYRDHQDETGLAALKALKEPTKAIARPHDPPTKRAKAMKANLKPVRTPEKTTAALKPSAGKGHPLANPKQNMAKKPATANSPAISTATEQAELTPQNPTTITAQPIEALTDPAPDKDVELLKAMIAHATGRAPKVIVEPQGQK